MINQADDPKQNIFQIVWNLGLLPDLFSFWQLTGRISASDVVVVLQILLIRLSQLRPFHAKFLHFLAYLLQTFNSVAAWLGYSVSKVNLLKFLSLIELYGPFMTRRFHYSCSYRQPRL